MERSELYLDTHVVIWLHSKKLEKFSNHILEEIDQSNLLISPMVSLELTYLNEIGRINVSSDIILASLQEEIGLNICTFSFQEVITAAIKETWTRDPFDRIITAQAAINDCFLITKDTTILKYYKNALWN